jgi:hypothetical protein
MMDDEQPSLLETVVAERSNDMPEPPGLELTRNESAQPVVLAPQPGVDNSVPCESQLVGSDLLTKEQTTTQRLEKGCGSAGTGDANKAVSKISEKTQEMPQVKKTLTREEVHAYLYGPKIQSTKPIVATVKPVDTAKVDEKRGPKSNGESHVGENEAVQGKRKRGRPWFINVGRVPG